MTGTGTQKITLKHRAFIGMMALCVLGLSGSATVWASPSPSSPAGGAAAASGAGAGALSQPATGGTVDPAGTTAGCVDRTRFKTELDGNDALINSFCGLMQVEVGSMTDSCKIQFFESVMNRAFARCQECTNPGGGKGSINFEINTNINYWGEKGRRDQTDIAKCRELISVALSGSNLSNFSTDNSSAGVAQGKINAGAGSRRGHWCGTDGKSEYFSTDSWAEPAMQKLIERAPHAQCTPFNVSGGTTAGTGKDVGAGNSGTSPGSSTPGGGGSSVHFSNLAEALKTIWVAAFQLMTEQLTAAMIHQVQAVGMMFDAKEQMEAQRDFQERYAQAHKDYHPSEQMCEIGTMVRNLANTDDRARLTALTVSNRMLARELATGDSMTVEGPLSDTRSRLKNFRDKHCTKQDNGGGLKNLCETEADKKRLNRDVDFIQSVEVPLTLPVDFLDTETTPEEEDLFALVNYLFMHRTPIQIPPNYTTNPDFPKLYQDLRSVIAMRGVARNSIAHIIAEKTAGPKNEDDNVNNAAPYIKSLLKEFGLSDEEIKAMVGDRPSYFAQMEILTKKVYQHPNFVVNLYDKPTNVKRIRAAMRAIKLMQDRDIHEALLRREMLLSMILEARLRVYQDTLYNRVNATIQFTP